MAIWTDMLNRLNLASRPASSSSRVIQAQITPTVIRYIDVLLSNLVESRVEATLRTSEELPSFSAMGGEPPPCDRVLNRLKVLSGLTPVAYAQPVSGQFDHTLRHRTVRVSASFVDRPGDSSCCLSVRDVSGARSSPQNPTTTRGRA